MGCCAALQPLAMPRRHDNLFGGIAGFQYLLAAARKAIRGKRAKQVPTAFMANLEREVLRLERELTSRTWRPGRYVTIMVKHPKPRMVSAAPFRDRVVHHALCAVVTPIFEAGFIPDSYANRDAKGTHRAVDRYEYFRDRFRHVLRCDIFRYFPAIDHAVLKADLRRRIACADTLWLLDAIIDGSNPQEPVNIHYPGDDLLAPLTRRRGLPIGNLTSQFFANLYLDGMDHFIKEVLRAKGYVRYVDDFALFHDDPVVLAGWRDRLVAYLAKRRLSLHPRKTEILPTAASVPFLGYVLYPDHRRLPEDNVRRFRGRLRSLRDRWRAGTVGLGEAEQKIGAWIAHAEHANTWRLRHAIFRDRMFDPALKPDRPLPATASIGAAPGTTIQGTSAPPTATTTPRTTETTIWESVSPARADAGMGVFTDAPSVSRSVQGRPW